MNNRQDDILVSICCTTFNHGEYIKDAIEGFLMQKTTFAFEVIIHDDASTDKTVEILKFYENNYSSILQVMYQTSNQYSKGIAPMREFVLPRAKGKYIAFCEGDDYWTDPYKLQKQVDFLEKNIDYGMCYTRAKSYIQDKNRYGAILGFKREKFEDLISANAIPTLTVCTKKQLVDAYVEDINPASKKWLMGDYPTWLWIAYNSKIKYMDDITAVYRVLSESASHSSNIEKHVQFSKNSYDICCFFAEKYNCKFTDIFDEHYIRALFFFDSGNRKNAKKEFELAHISKNQRIYLLASNNTVFYNFFLFLRKFKRCFGH